MLFVSPHALFLLTGAVQERDEYHPTSGKYLGTKPGVDCQFRIGLAPEWALDQAMEIFGVQLQQGLADGEDPRLNISCFDTDLEARQNRWTPEIQREVEEYLLERQDQFYRLIEPAPVPKPWPAYDETHWAQVVKTAREIGVTPEQILAYEHQAKNRPSVVEAVEAWAAEVAKPEPEEELVLA